MNATLPFQNLHRLNILMTICINMFVSVILLISGSTDNTEIFFIFLRGAIVIYILGMINIFTIYLFRKNYIKAHPQRTDLLQYLVSTLLSLFVFSCLTLAFSYLQGKQNELFDQNRIIIHFIAFVVFNTLTIVFQNQVLLQHSKAHSELENMQLKAAIAEASNLLLRQQIHPHFLFNSLTTLKSLYKKEPAKGEFYITTLANFLRASISNHTAKISRLDVELALCRDYMEMQKIRFDTAIEYIVDIPEDRRGFLPFFSIQVLLENAIKHNALTDANPLKLEVFENDGHITVRNNLQAKKNKEVSTGSGLANLSERYQLLSGHPILIDQNADRFSVSIKLYTDENCNY